MNAIPTYEDVKREKPSHLRTPPDRFIEEALTGSDQDDLYITPTPWNTVVNGLDWVHHEGKNKGKIALYALSTCVWCKKTKQLLTELGVDFSYIFVDELSPKEMEKVVEEVKKWNPAGSFPVLVIDDSKCIVGFREKEIREALE
jgi:glutaredoxin-like protein NrdH